MTTIEFGSKTAADAVRDEFADHLCSDDDRRLKEVVFASTTPDDVLDQARQQALDSRAERETGPGQAPLTDHERGEIDFSKGRANVLWARSIKGIAADEGVDDWTAHVDPSLTVDEHREVMEKAAREGGGRRREDTETGVEKAGRASRRAQAEGCDHARGHCEAGDPDACEHLKSRCGLSDSEVQSLLSDFDGDDSDDQGIEGAAAGALDRSWSGYQGAVRRLSQAIEAADQAWTNAQQAAKAINGVRDGHGQDPIHFETLEAAQADLLDLSRKAAADCHECHADHSGHDHAVTDGNRERVPEAVVDGASETPVGTSDDTDQALEADPQRDLSGGRANDQARFAGGEQGERGQGETVETVAENPGGMMADERDRTDSDPSEEGTEQQIPDEFAVAEGGQETL